MSEEAKMALFVFTVGAILLTIGIILDETRNN
jgi:hypothetical protein